MGLLSAALENTRSVKLAAYPFAVVRKTDKMAIAIRRMYRRAGKTRTREVAALKLSDMMAAHGSPAPSDVLVISICFSLVLKLFCRKIRVQYCPWRDRLAAGLAVIMRRHASQTEIIV